MTEPQRNQTVLIVDEDLGFVFWLGQVLADAGYQAVPALGCQEALDNIRQLKVIVDAVCVNPALSSTVDLLQTLGSAKTQLRIILIMNHDGDTLGTIPGHAILVKPCEWEEISRQEWLRKIKQALTDESPLALRAKTTA